MPLWPGFMAGQPGRPVRVLLIDDDENMRRVIAQELLADLRIDLLAQGASVRDGRRLIDAHDFDVLLVDLNLGDGTGFTLIERTKQLRPLAEAVVISATAEEQHALHAFALGATGYIEKASWFGSFVQAVLQVVNGGACITPSLTRRLLGKLDYSPAVSSPNYKLSAREKEVLSLVAAGLDSPAIGQHLAISEQTVNTHIKNIFRKLGAGTRAQAVSLGASLGLLK